VVKFTISHTIDSSPPVVHKGFQQFVLEKAPWLQIDHYNVNMGFVGENNYFYLEINSKGMVVLTTANFKV